MTGEFAAGDWVGTEVHNESRAGTDCFLRWHQAGGSVDTTARPQRTAEEIKAELVRRAEFDRVDAYWITDSGPQLLASYRQARGPESTERSMHETEGSLKVHGDPLDVRAPSSQR